MAVLIKDCSIWNKTKKTALIGCWSRSNFVTAAVLLEKVNKTFAIASHNHIYEEMMMTQRAFLLSLVVSVVMCRITFAMAANFVRLNVERYGKTRFGSIRPLDLCVCRKYSLSLSREWFRRSQFKWARSIMIECLCGILVLSLFMKELPIVQL